jgi:anti-sigma-K factor RskA
MNERNRDLLDRLAAEYVLGTLRGPARRRFERLSARSELAGGAVRRWEDRFTGIALGVQAVRPSNRVWSDVVRRIDEIEHAQGRRHGVRPWQLALAASLVGIVVAFGWYRFGQDLRPETVAQFATTDGRELWRVEASHDTTKLSVAAIGSVDLQPEHSYELWALPEGGTPVSLGLMPTTGSASEALTDAQRAALLKSRKLAISLEPSGGSPTGAPTGPVLHVVDWVAQS